MMWYVVVLNMYSTLLFYQLMVIQYTEHAAHSAMVWINFFHSVILAPWNEFTCISKRI